MYVWIWRTLPGPLAVRMLQVLVLLALLLTVLFLYAFPYVEAQLPYSDVTVPAPAQSELPAE